MAATQQQRAALYTTLADTMGEEASDTLMGEPPTAGWEQIATKDDLAALETRSAAALTEGLAEAATERAELNIKLTAGLAEAATERAELNIKLTAGLAEAATERAELNVKLTEGLSEMSNKLTEGLTEISNKLTESLADAAADRAELGAKLTAGLAAAAADRAELGAKLTAGLAAAEADRAKLFRSQARQLYVTVSAIAAASVSIWIALFTMLG